MLSFHAEEKKFAPILLFSAPSLPPPSSCPPDLAHSRRSFRLRLRGLQEFKSLSTSDSALFPTLDPDEDAGGDLLLTAAAAAAVMEAEAEAEELEELTERDDRSGHVW